MQCDRWRTNKSKFSRHKFDFDGVRHKTLAPKRPCARGREWVILIHKGGNCNRTSQIFCQYLSISWTILRSFNFETPVDPLNPTGLATPLQGHMVPTSYLQNKDETRWYKSHWKPIDESQMSRRQRGDYQNVSALCMCMRQFELVT